MIEQQPPPRIVREAIVGPSIIPDIFVEHLERIDAKIASVNKLGLAPEGSEWIDQNGIDWGDEFSFKQHKAEACGCPSCVKAHDALFIRRREIVVFDDCNGNGSIGL